jgi:type IV secretory pathway VirD2 relaxase
MASLPKDAGEWRSDSAGRFRSRRVVVKARVVKLNPQRGSQATRMRGTVSRAVDAHLRYLEREGVTRDGERGTAYSAFENEADGNAFAERGRGDRHQFRLIVAPEDASEMADLRSFTRDLMRQMEQDLSTRLDWIAVDHHNTGHPHTHVLLRGVTDDGKILNVADDYIAHGIRHRASDLVTRELGHQSEIELQTKLAHEVTAERLTRLDKALLSEQREASLIDLRPGEGASYPVRENRTLMVGRIKQLERYGLASETESGRWVVSDRTEMTLKELGARNDIIQTMHRALADNGLADLRGASQYALHGSRIDQTVVGRLVAKGLAGDELEDRAYIVIDGVDGRVHHLEVSDPANLNEAKRGMIVEASPVISAPRSADRNLAINAEEDGGLYRPSRHLEKIRDRFESQGKDAEAFVRSHVRRLEALRRAGLVERIDNEQWRIPKDIVARGQAYDLSQGGDGVRVRILSTYDLERQITSDGVTWLDRQMAAGFGKEVRNAMYRRAERLVEMRHATARDGAIVVSRNALSALERQEVQRVGQRLAAERGLTFRSGGAGQYATGRLSGVASLASGRFAMIEDGLSFQLVPWQPVLEKRIGQYITGLQREDGGIEWSFGRKRGLEL